LVDTLRRLDLDYCVGVNDLSPLAILKELYSLNLTGCVGVTDLTPLVALDKLQFLYLGSLGHKLPIPKSLRSKVQFFDLPQFPDSANPVQ
jgi:internalin A